MRLKNIPLLISQTFPSLLEQPSTLGCQLNMLRCCLSYTVLSYYCIQQFVLCIGSSPKLSSVQRRAVTSGS